MKKVGIGVITLMCVLLLSGCGGDKGKSYVVTFNTDGGTKISSVEVKENEKVSKPKEPTKEGYSFDGWYKDDVKYDFDTSITGNITLKAKWVKGEGKGSTSVSFDVDGGNAVSDLDAKVGEKIGKLPTPKKDGYTFLGWYNGNTKVTEDTIVTAGMKLTAKWEKNSGNTGTVSKPNGGSNTGTSTANKVTVTFNSDGGSKVDSITVNKGSKIKEPSAPTKDGYKFAGWYLENGNKANFSVAITRDIKLTARWTKNEGSKPVDPEPSDPDVPSVTKYTVSFNTDGGSTVASQEVESGKTATKPADPTKSGYTFAGWTLSGSAYDFGKAVTSNITLVATWNKVVEDVYTYSTEALDMAKITYKVYIYKNGVKVAANNSMAVVAGTQRVAKYSSQYGELTADAGDLVKLAGATLRIDGKQVTLK